MTFLDLTRGLGVCAALAVLAGCGGGAQSPLAPSGSFQQSTTGGLARRGVPPAHVDDARSWMAPDAASTHDLLYVSDLSGNAVNVYSYPGGKAMGKLKDDIAAPDGLCVDKKQNVWIVNNAGAADVAVEYKHGGKTHIGAVQDPGLSAHIGCTVDPTTGDLAVTTYGVSSYGGGLVAIYAHAKGTPQHYTDSKIPHFNFCGYDSKGNLYCDGTDAAQGQFRFAELAKGAKTFKNITLSGGAIYYPGNVQWDGKYVAIGDQSVQNLNVSAIYQTTGSGGKIVHETPLDDPTDGSSEDIVQFWIDGNAVIGPNNYGSDAGFYKYPAGGKPTKTIKGPYAFGAAISE
jgi:hypothetical protein